MNRYGLRNQFDTLKRILTLINLKENCIIGILTNQLMHFVLIVWDASGQGQMTSAVQVFLLSLSTSLSLSLWFTSRFPYYWSCWVELSSVILDTQTFNNTVKSIRNQFFLKYFFQLYTTNRLLTVLIFLLC